MSDIALSVRALSKAYTIAHNAASHVTLTEAALARLRRPLARPQRETFWALKDVSFDIKRGDVVGVIGRNGAGKSTLLKILSRITEPTEGEIDVYGRIGSLLEVGTGFHPELTGRENIYLNGAILGMRKAEIRKQFDAIVDFAGVEKFLDTPVKRYSSGMYVRLAFAVAAHLETEILVVDEVLAVGDAEFQRKCLGKMKDVARGGRTVLFVSHHMQSVQVLCNCALYLDRGQCPYFGVVEGAVDRYSASFQAGSHTQIDPNRRPGTGEYRITRIEPAGAIFNCGDVKEFDVEVECRRPGSAGAYLNISVFDAIGAKVATCDMRTANRTLPANGKYIARLRIATPWFRPGEYRVLAKVCNFGTVDIIEDACQFTVSDVQPYAVALNDPLAIEGTVLADYEYAEVVQNLGGDPGEAA